MVKIFYIQDKSQNYLIKLKKIINQSIHTYKH